MGILSSLFGKRTPSEPVEIHIGHFAALGAKSATMLSQQCIRHTAMTQEHLMMQGADGGLRLVGWGNTAEIDWPDRALEHVEDIETFRAEFGAGPTAGLRYGYVYQLGPIGEWLFYAATPRLNSEAKPPAFWQIQWEPPPDRRALGEDGVHVDDTPVSSVNSGTVDARGQAVARRVLMAQLLRGIVAQDRAVEFSTLYELAMVSDQEGRPIRALAYGTLAAGRSDLDDMETNRRLQAVLERAKQEASQAALRDVESVMSRSTTLSPLELVWAFEDLEIAEAIRG